jgi:hypothetical protein
LGPAFSARGILVWETSINPKGGHMKLIGTITVLAAAVAALLVPTAGAATTAAPAAAQLSQFEGTVVSVNHDARTFRLRDTERGTARIKVTSRTRFERIAGFSALRAGAPDRGEREAAERRLGRGRGRALGRRGRARR